MNVLDAARRLAASEPVCEDGNSCHYGCGAGNTNGWTHEPECPVLALPQIVAALEAAQATADYAAEILNKTGDCPICTGDPTEHMAYCPIGPLLEAHGVVYEEY